MLVCSARYQPSSSKAITVPSVNEQQHKPYKPVDLKTVLLFVTLFHPMCLASFSKRKFIWCESRRGRGSSWLSRKKEICILNIRRIVEDFESRAILADFLAQSHIK